MAATTTINGNIISVTWAAGASGDWKISETTVGSIMAELGGGEGPMVARLGITTVNGSQDSYVAILNGLNSSAPKLATLRTEASDDHSFLELHQHCLPYIDYSNSKVFKGGKTTVQIILE